MNADTRRDHSCIAPPAGAILLPMNTLTEIEAAADRLPLEEKRELMLFLAVRLRADGAQMSEPVFRFRCSKRGFPISKGRRPFTSEEVARIEAEG